MDLIDNWSEMGGYYILTRFGKRIAVIFWLGGYVERSDSWHVKFADHSEGKQWNDHYIAFETLKEAQRFAEKEA